MDLTLYLPKNNLGFSSCFSPKGTYGWTSALERGGYPDNRTAVLAVRKQKRKRLTPIAPRDGWMLVRHR
jgi:hypothetical protein